MSSNNWIPEIMYEENKDGVSGGFPFIDVPEDKNMPACLFICEARKVSEDGTDIEKELTFHSYANMTLLKQKLSAETFDLVRVTLGLKPLLEAEAKGKEIITSLFKKYLYILY